MKACVAPAQLAGALSAIPSKSDVHRMLICAALADGETTIKFAGTSGDIEATIRCLRSLGAGVERRADGLVVTPIAASGIADADADGIASAVKPLVECGESGSTLRFLLPVSATVCDGARFTGEGRLPERPIDDLVAVMAAHGVSFSQRALPFETGGRLGAGMYRFPGNISSQYVSGLLLALPRVTGKSTISLTTPLESASYVKMTLEALAAFGVKVDAHAAEWNIEGPQAYVSPGTLEPGGDWSNAAAYLAAGALGGRGTGASGARAEDGAAGSGTKNGAADSGTKNGAASSGITVSGLSLASLQGDRMIVDLLERFGADVSVVREGGMGMCSVTVKPGKLVGCEIDVSDCPDLLPVLAVVACGAAGRTHLFNAERLRLKESDRLATTAALIDALGGEVEELEGGLAIIGQGTGRPLSGGEAQTAGDHRIVMAAALAALLCEKPVTIDRAETVAKSYPTFFEDYQMLGGAVEMLDEAPSASSDASKGR